MCESVRVYICEWCYVYMQVCVSVWEVEVKELEMSILVWSRGKYMNESEVALHLDPMPRLLSSLLFRLSVSAKYRSGKKGMEDQCDGLQG